MQAQTAFLGHLLENGDDGRRGLAVGRDDVEKPVGLAGIPAVVLRANRKHGGPDRVADIRLQNAVATGVARRRRAPAMPDRRRKDRQESSGDAGRYSRCFGSIGAVARVCDELWAPVASPPCGE